MTFTYPSATRPALREVSIEVKAGEIVALVGENGSGKTTLAKLLCRLYLPETGRISWDGVDTADVDPDSLRRSTAVNFQDFLHYALSARDLILDEPTAVLDPRPNTPCSPACAACTQDGRCC